MKNFFYPSLRLVSGNYSNADNIPHRPPTIKETNVTITHVDTNNDEPPIIKAYNKPQKINAVLEPINAAFNVRGIAEEPAFTTKTSSN